MDFIQGLWNEVASGARPMLTALFFLNIALLVLARPIVRLIEPGEQDPTSKVRILQALNLLVLLFHGVDFALRQFVPGYEGYVIKLGGSLMVVYSGVFLYSLAGTLSRRRFGRKRELDNKTVHVETYNSRLVGIVLLAVIALTVVYILIKIWGADSLLETTGIFGIFIAFLAFTSGIWAPDIVSGLIILNSDILVDGDVVVIDGHPDEFIIARVTLIYVVLYDVRNNHRTLLRNTQFIQSRIDNLSRIASTDGIRLPFRYNIGYPDMPETREARISELTGYRKRIDRMFEAAYAACTADDNVRVNPNTKFEWAMTNAGDDALEYTLWIYLERIPNTKITATVRRHLMGTLYRTNEAVLTAAMAEGIDLSTPKLVDAKLQGRAAATLPPDMAAAGTRAPSSDAASV